VEAEVEVEAEAEAAVEAEVEVEVEAGFGLGTSSDRHLTTLSNRSSTRFMKTWQNLLLGLAAAEVEAAVEAQVEVEAEAESAVEEDAPISKGKTETKGSDGRCYGRNLQKRKRISSLSRKDVNPLSKRRR